MQRELLKDNFNALLETGSLLGHDLSGQYHVIQFCLDELAERPLDDQTMRFVKRIGESVEELIRLTEQARRVFRESILPNRQGELEPKSLQEVLELAATQYYVHAAKSWPALEVRLSGEGEIECSLEAQLYWCLVLPSLMARVQLSLKNSSPAVLEIIMGPWGDERSGWRVRVIYEDQSIWGNLADTSVFMGERERRFSWGAQVLEASLDKGKVVSCQCTSEGLVFTFEN